MAVLDGWTVALEPRVPGGVGRADLKLHGSDGDAAFVETVVMGISDEERRAHRYFEAVTTPVQLFAATYGVHITGSTGHVAEMEAVHRWLQEVEQAAATTAADGVLREVAGPSGGALIISASPLQDTSLRGPATLTDEGGRLAARIAEKAKQTAGAPHTWVRLDAHALLWMLSDWGRSPVTAKLITFAPLVREALADAPHVAGVILSNGWAWRIAGEEDEACVVPGGLAIRRALPATRYRETLIVASTPDGVTQPWNEWYASESTWLDRALDHLGHPPLAALLAPTLG
ncbi:MAG: hypothetical protein M0Z34_06775 [Nitrospiraceae bacterium]|nr:hypothetical protein [Nitrospiraceae bacterium]